MRTRTPPPNVGDRIVYIGGKSTRARANIPGTVREVRQPSGTGIPFVIEWDSLPPYGDKVETWNWWWAGFEEIRFKIFRSRRSKRMGRRPGAAMKIKDGWYRLPGDGKGADGTREWDSRVAGHRSVFWVKVYEGKAIDYCTYEEGPERTPEEFAKRFPELVTGNQPCQGSLTGFAELEKHWGATWLELLKPKSSGLGVGTIGLGLLAILTCTEVAKRTAKQKASLPAQHRSVG